MRTAARRVGEALAGEHRYRGAFGIDGILTADGFRPHELNPRFSGGINTLNKGTADVPLNLLDQTVRSGANLDVDLEAVETVLLDAADANRAGSAYLATDAVTHRRRPRCSCAAPPMIYAPATTTPPLSAPSNSDPQRWARWCGSLPSTSRTASG